MKMFWPKKDFMSAYQHLQNQSIDRTFSQSAVEFTTALSKKFLKIKNTPEIVALGFWLRKANIQQMKNQFLQKKDSSIIKARGTIFHIAPSNVDTIFVYSWILSLITGNRNIIRLSTKTELNQLLQLILEELPNHPVVAERTLICTYEHTENLTNLISENCHTRVIWGGDQTIRSIREIPLAPLANELAFADRFSLSVLNGEIIDRLEERELNTLVEKFYNDSFWFNQMACSSPRLIIWLKHSSKRFWIELEKKIREKQYELLAATQMIKYTTALELTTYNAVEQVVSNPYITRIEVETIQDHIKELHCGNGVFYEVTCSELYEISKYISDKDQTMSYYGLTQMELAAIIEQIDTRGIDRIVPVGQALDFDYIWDGQNFLTSFTREVVLK